MKSRKVNIKMSSIKNLLFSIVLFWGGYSANAQKIDTNIVLKTVDITAAKIKYMAANKTQNIDSIQIKSVSSDNLNSVLSKYTTIYIKQNAGGLSTIHFRGTSANHTAILYNGININSLTLGHSNIASIPVFLFNDIMVQFGSSSSLYGTDAIGGSIHINNKVKWNQGFTLGLQQDIGSFHSYFSGIQLSYSNNRFSYLIKSFRLKKKNDFSFKNLQAKDFETNEYRIDTTKNSKTLNYGILQSINYSLNTNLLTHFDIWYEDNWRQIQPNMSANYYGGDFAEILNKNLRAITGIKYYFGSQKLTIDVGYVSDYQLYNKNKDNFISTKSVLGRINYFNKNIWQGDINIGLNLKHINPQVYAYDKNPDEYRFDAFLSYKKLLFKRFLSSINIRQAYVTNYGNHFTPTVGIKYILNNKDNHNSSSIKASYSNSYKIPTLNDRYWLPTGNPDILAENANTTEVSYLYSTGTNHNNFHITLTGFYMIIDNWIQWVNLGVWQPVNKKKVRSDGIELNTRFERKINKTKISANLNFTFNNVNEIESYTGTPVSGNQIIYTPKFMGTTGLNIKSKNWLWQNSLSYTGTRLTETGKALGNFMLWDTYFERKINLKNSSFTLGLAINNILNIEYQNWEYYAMPGRNYKFSLKYFIGKQKKSDKT